MGVPNVTSLPPRVTNLLEGFILVQENFNVIRIPHLQMGNNGVQLLGIVYPLNLLKKLSNFSSYIGRDIESNAGFSVGWKLIFGVVNDILYLQK